MSSPEVGLTGELLHEVDANVVAEGASVTMDVLADHNNMSWEFLLFDVESFGGEDSGISSGGTGPGA